MMTTKMTTMKACLAHPGGKLSWEDRPAPTAAPDGVVIEVAVGGICGSDLHYARHGANGNSTIREPLVLGHEIAGVVREVGPEVTTFTVGHRVTVHPGWPQPNTSSAIPSNLLAGTYLGSAATLPHTQGGFCELLAVRAAQVRTLPDNLPLDRAVLAEPLAVALHAVGRAGDVTGLRALVSGAGPIGTLAVAALKARGAAEVTAVDLHKLPLSLATIAGADHTVRLGTDPLDDDAYDVVIEAAGVPASLGTGIRAARRGGVVVQLGVLADRPLEISLASLLTKEVDLRGSQRFNDEIDEAVAVLASKPGLAELVTHRFDSDRADEAFAVAADPATSGKVVLVF